VHPEILTVFRVPSGTWPPLHVTVVHGGECKHPDPQENRLAEFAPDRPGHVKQRVSPKSTGNEIVPVISPLQVAFCQNPTVTTRCPPLAVGAVGAAKGEAGSATSSLSWHPCTHSSNTVKNITTTIRVRSVFMPPKKIRQERRPARDDSVTFSAHQDSSMSLTKR
jgi:hypothetical protein